MGHSLLIANQDPEMATMISSELSCEGYSVTLVHDGRELIEKIKTQDFQLLMTDSELPEYSGGSLLQKIRTVKSRAELSILILSSPMEDAAVLGALNQGADDFLFKPYQRTQLVSRVQNLLKRMTNHQDDPMIFKDGQYTYGPFRLNIHSFDFYLGETRTHLTPSEFKLLEALFRKQGGILTRDELIREVQGDGVAVIERAIDTHVFSLRKKLGESSHLIETVRGIGYRLQLSSEK